MINFNFIINRSGVQDKLYIDDFGYYDYDKNCVNIILPTHNIYSKNECELVKNVCDTISHETIHCVIWSCRKNYKNKLRFDFFEEKIVAEALGNEFDEEEYYYLIQEEEE